MFEIAWPNTPDQKSNKEANDQNYSESLQNWKKSKDFLIKSAFSCIVCSFHIHKKTLIYSNHIFINKHTLKCLILTNLPYILISLSFFFGYNYFDFVLRRNTPVRGRAFKHFTVWSVWYGFGETGAGGVGARGSAGRGAGRGHGPGARGPPPPPRDTMAASAQPRAAHRKAGMLSFWPLVFHVPIFWHRWISFQHHRSHIR